MDVLGTLFAGLVLAAWFVVWGGALLEAYRTSDEDWRAAGESRATWMLLIFVFQVFGLAAFVWWIRPKLRAARAAREVPSS